jgi:hypothetical protein
MTSPVAGKFRSHVVRRVKDKDGRAEVMTVVCSGMEFWQMVCDGWSRAAPEDRNLYDGEDDGPGRSEA